MEIEVKSFEQHPTGGYEARHNARRLEGSRQTQSDLVNCQSFYVRSSATTLVLSQLTEGRNFAPALLPFK